jgi:hypothetical protein
VPDLRTRLHLDMLAEARTGRWPVAQDLYGLQWGDPNVVPWLRHVRDDFLLPFVQPDRVGVEIGPGGGRWSRYMLSLQRFYAVDFHQELLDELAKNFRTPGLFFVKNNGTDFPGIAEHSVDLVFSFGVFVHLDVPIIDAYLGSIAQIIRPGADVVLQYADKTKPEARDNPTFSDNNPEVMRALLATRGYRILRENVSTLPHSAIVHFTLGD